ncbi:Centrosomal protein of 78 kDa isoform 1 [Schistosoma japonicum]|uniref:Centrosomal protein of 78 kDa isoform 1 n=1 Tax=Schistosoma japonicum TaxID=6182 RepID=A0A4Z2D1D7_SCHJA|nr:Centrosomal protein of 78 kDa isoform 1 [Schistosoma japonicum]
MIPTVKERQAGSYDFKNYYENLCALRNCTPISSITGYVGHGVLDINADRIRIQEWDPILDAVKINKNLNFIAIRSFYKFSVPDGVNTFNRQRVPILLISPKLLLSLCKSLRHCMWITENLTFLELQNLPLIKTSLQQICEGIRKNRTLKHLSFEGSSVNDDGLKEICRILRNVPNISTLNLTSCNLSKEGISALTVLINFQAMQRHNAAWQESLRYRYPELDRLGGLKRITLNDNPKIGDEGSILLADALIDDLWVKAIDLQACNLGDSSASTWLAVLIGLRIATGSHQTTTHDELQMKSDKSTIDDQHRGNYSLVVLDLRRNPNISRDLLRAVTERALINSEGKQTEFSWLKAGSQTPSQLCSGVTTYPWPGLTGITNISNIHQSKSIKLINNSCQIKSISNNSLDYGKLTNFNNLNNVHRSYKCNNLTDRPPFIPAGGRLRSRSAEPTHYIDHHSTQSKCVNVGLSRKCNHYSLCCCESGPPLSERAAWKPPGIAKINKTYNNSRPNTPLSSRTSCTGIPWRTAARASRCRGYPTFHCPGKTCLESRALHLDYNLVNKHTMNKLSTNVNNLHQNESVIHPSVRSLNKVTNDDDCQLHHHHRHHQQQQQQQQRLQHNRQYSNQKLHTKMNSRINSSKLSEMNFQQKFKQLMMKVSQLEKDLQTEKQKSNQLIKNHQCIQHQENKLNHPLRIDQDSIHELRNFIYRLTNHIEKLQNSKKKTNSFNEELNILQDTFEELCCLISRITENGNYSNDSVPSNTEQIEKNISKNQHTTADIEMSSSSSGSNNNNNNTNNRSKERRKFKNIHTTEQSFKYNPRRTTKPLKGHVQWKTVAKTRCVQTENLQNSIKINENSKVTQHKECKLSNRHVEWMPTSTCTTTSADMTRVPLTNSYNHHHQQQQQQQQQQKQHHINNELDSLNLEVDEIQQHIEQNNNTSTTNNLWIMNYDNDVTNDNSIDNHNESNQLNDSNSMKHLLIDNFEIYKKSSEIDQVYAELKAATLIGTSSNDNHDIKNQSYDDDDDDETNIKQMKSFTSEKKSDEISDVNKASILNDVSSSTCRL